MRIAIVCEGSTDFAVLCRLVLAVVPGPDVIVVQAHPSFDALRARSGDAVATGWTGVRAYLQSAASALVASATDVLVVQIDADVRLLPQVVGALRESRRGDDDLDPFCDHVKGWFRGGVPASALVAIPREATEAWLLGVHTNVMDPEGDPRPADTLVVKGAISGPTGGSAKKAERYAALAEPLARIVADRKKLAGLQLPELERFVGKLQALARRARKAR